MTSDPSQIQSLIKEIDEVLSKTTPRLPWVMSSDAAQQRQVLEQTRSYLLQSLQQAESPDPHASSATNPTVNSGGHSLATTPVTEASAQQVLQAVVQEMNYLRSNMLQPMRSDVDTLRLQREALLQEIRQLEMQRQQYQLPQNPQAMTEFLRATMAQMQENLAGQMAQMMATLMPQAPNAQRLAGSAPPLSLEADSSNLSALSPAERLQYMQRLQAQSDQLMLRLDATLRVVFESLQNNLTSYRDSLEEGLGRMHETGQQGEAVFGAFVTRLAQMMGREASPLLQGQSGDWRSDRPYLREAGIQENSDSQINQLLQELNALDPTPLQRTMPGEPVPFDPSLATPENLPADLETASLEQLDRELSRLDLMALSSEVELLENEITLLPNAPFPAVLDDALAADNTRFPEPVEPILPSPPEAGLTEAELESALDLLSQITADSALAEPPLTQPPEESPEVTSAPPAEMPLVAQPEALYEDEFYQSLFGQPPVSEGDSLDSPAPSANGNPEAFPSEIASMLYQEPEAEELSPEFDPNADIDLFAGLPDPALQVTEVTDTPALEIPAPPFPQTIENLLLQSADLAAPAEAETLEGFFVGEEVAVEAAPEAPAASIETIASLLELVPDAVIPSEHPLVPPVTQPLADRLEESYELAQPGEDLLAAPVSSYSDDLPELQLPLDTLQQLTADLSNLEAARNASPDLVDESGWQLGDWMTQPAEANQLDAEQDAEMGGSASLQPSVPDITVEDLLFGDDLDSVVVTETPALSDFTAIDALSQPAASTAELKTANELLESTIEDWFASVEAESVEARPDGARPDQAGLNEAGLNEARSDRPPVGNPETDTNSDLFAWYEQATGKHKKSDDANAFTLDGLDDLFEGVPPLGTAAPAENQDNAEPPDLTIDTAFAGDESTAVWETSPEPEKKKREFGS